MDLNVNIISKSGTNSVELPTTFAHQADLREYLSRLAESKLDDIAQDLAKKIDGGFALQTPTQDKDFERFTKRIDPIEKPGTYLSTYNGKKVGPKYRETLFTYIWCTSLRMENL